MNISQIYIVISIVVLLLVALLVYFTSRNKKSGTFSPLAGLAFGFILAGLFFGERRAIGYSLLGFGVVLAVVDIIRQSRSR
jgi:MFS-type transporter involved in bile tolerance (Atg22 family)